MCQRDYITDSSVDKHKSVHAAAVLDFSKAFVQVSSYRQPISRSYATRKPEI